MATSISMPRNGVGVTKGSMDFRSYSWKNDLRLPSVAFWNKS